MTTDPSTQGEARDGLVRFITESDLAGKHVRIVPLTGDASDRRYFRVHSSDRPSFVVATHTGPIAFETSTFAGVHRLLARMAVPVPRILGYSDALGIIAQEDLGDVTLQAHVGTATPSEHARLYQEAVGLITTLQRRGAELAAPEYPPYGVAFDVEKLTWELDFFATHFLAAYRGVTLAPAEREALATEFASIVHELAAEPRVVCHRDYHSRNLMLHGGHLYVIDFQDARMGPDTYDLVSLLRDSYVDLEDAQVEALIACFLDGQRDAGGRGAPPEEFRRRFDLMALQRNLKALGTFGFQAAAKGNPVYLQYIPRTLAYVRANLAAYPRFARLRGLLSAHLTELR